MDGPTLSALVRHTLRKTRRLEKLTVPLESFFIRSYIAASSGFLQPGSCSRFFKQVTVTLEIRDQLAIGKSKLAEGEIGERYLAYPLPAAAGFFSLRALREVPRRCAQHCASDYQQADAPPAASQFEPPSVPQLTPAKQCCLSTTGRLFRNNAGGASLLLVRFKSAGFAA